MPRHSLHALGFPAGLRAGRNPAYAGQKAED